MFCLAIAYNQGGGDKPGHEPKLRRSGMDEFFVAERLRLTSFAKIG